ncbi:site-specific integrase [Kribbella alba]
MSPLLAEAAPTLRGPLPKGIITTTAVVLGAFLRIALEDRYSGMCVLAATTGMRRSELAGVERHMVDLDSGVLDIGDTRVVVGGKAQASDGKSEAGRRGISLDTFAVIILRKHIDRINEEREAHGKSYPNTDYLMVGPEGRPLRHTYATIAQDAGHNIKTLSERIGHADVTVTGQIHTHKWRGTDRAMAQAIGEPIELATTGTTHEQPSWVRIWVRIAESWPTTRPTSRPSPSPGRHARESRTRQTRRSKPT